jgi:hypothetical protein
MRSLIGHNLNAITLNVTSEDAAGFWIEALTDNYLKLRLRGRHAPNQWIRAQVEAVEDGILRGRVSSAAEDLGARYSAESVSDTYLTAGAASHTYMAAPQLGAGYSTLSIATNRAAKRRKIAAQGASPG